MCRLFAQISASSASADDFLAQGKRSLLVQSDYQGTRRQNDGWGIGYFNGRPSVAKSPGAAYKEAVRFRNVSDKTRSKIIMGHLRAASNPLGLPKKRLIRPENAQPFSDDRFLFIHNGTVEIPLEVRRFLGPYRDRVRGDNDSEVYFWQFRKFFDLYRDAPRALEACVDELFALWKLCRHLHPSKKSPHLGLNAIVSDGTSLHAMCLPSPGSKSMSFFNPRQRWGTLSFARRDRRVVIASEDMDGGVWRHFREGEILSVVPSRTGFSLRRRKVNVPS